MISRLRSAEKTPNKGWKEFPKFEETEEESGEENDDEVMLLEDNGEKHSTQGETKQCLSNQVKQPREYDCAKAYFKIPKKSPPNSSHHSNNTSLNTNHDQRKSFASPRDNHCHTRDTRWFQSSFPKVSGLNIRQRIQRQDGSTRYSSNTLGQGKSSSLKKNKERNNPFYEEITMVMRRNTRNNKHSNEDDFSEKEPGMPSDIAEVITVEAKNSTDSTQETQSDDSSANPHDRGLEGESSTGNDSADQYSVNLYQDKMRAISNAKENITTRPKMCDCQKKSNPKNECRQCKMMHFPSAAATARNSIHEYSSTSDDEKGNTLNTNSFYGSANQSNFIKTYCNTKVRRKNNKVVSDWTEEDDNETSISTSDVDDLPAVNHKKRKVLHKKNMKEDHNTKKESSDSVKQRKKHKPEPEPDFYLISSSEEEDELSGLGDENTSGTETTIPNNNSQRNSITTENNVTTSGQNSDKAKEAFDNPFERDSFNAEIMLGPHVMIGKLCGLTNGALEINAHQLKWRMKYNDSDDKPVEQVVLILANDITSFKTHVNNEPKVILLSVNQRCALRLRGKISGLGKLFDPGSAVVEETQIVLQVDDTLSRELQADISEWVEERLSKYYVDLSSTEAEKLNEQLFSSADSTSKSGDTKPMLHYNTRSSVVKTSARTTVTPTKMIIYPPPPLQGGITVTSADVECLAEGQFLNDVIIDFYLKYVYHDKLSPDEHKRTHIFSSFFYKRLTQKNSNSNEFFHSPPDRMHSRVKKWTRHVDIFSKDFVIVPINESSHWYLAIICFPHLQEPIIEESVIEDDSSQEECDETVIEDSTDSDEKVEANVEDNVDEKKDDDDDDDGDDDDEAADPDRDLDLENSTLAAGAKKATPSKQLKQKHKPNMKASPCILIFDSLGSGGRSRVFTNLRNYLSSEWKVKHPGEPTQAFSKESFKGTFPKVPEQDNHCDCGIFVLQYVESFFKDPIQDYRTPIRKQNWFTHNGISGKRQDIKALILRLRDEYKASSS